MKFKNLPNAATDKIKTYRFDRIIEKHEGPEHWESMLKVYDVEFFNIEGKSVLLPVDQKHHKNITILRSILSKDESTLTVFFKDTTQVENPEHEYFHAGFVAVFDKLPGEDFFIAVLYHEWFIINEQVNAH